MGVMDLLHIFSSAPDSWPFASLTDSGGSASQVALQQSQ